MINLLCSCEKKPILEIGILNKKWTLSSVALKTQTMDPALQVLKWIKIKTWTTGRSSYGKDLGHRGGKNSDFFFLSMALILFHKQLQFWLLLTFVKPGSGYIYPWFLLMTSCRKTCTYGPFYGLFFNQLVLVLKLLKRSCFNLTWR